MCMFVNILEDIFELTDQRHDFEVTWNVKQKSHEQTSPEKV